MQGQGLHGPGSEGGQAKLAQLSPGQVALRMCRMGTRRR